MINLLCIFLTLYQLKRLYRDFTTKNLAAVRIAGLFTSLLSIQTEVGAGNRFQQRNIKSARRALNSKIRVFDIYVNIVIYFFSLHCQENF